jgi:hypothetical protein
MAVRSRSGAPSAAAALAVPAVDAHAFALRRHAAAAARRSAVSAVLAHLRKLWQRAERGFVDAALGTVALSSLKVSVLYVPLRFTRSMLTI